MRKWIIGLLAVLLVNHFGWWPFPQQDTGELFLVESLVVEGAEDGIRLRTEELSGQGTDFSAALEDLAKRAPGQLYLRQTGRVILCGDPDRISVLELPEDLPMGAYIYRFEGDGAMLDLEQLNDVLEAAERRRTDTPTLAALQNQALTGRLLTPEPLEMDDEA